MFQLQVITEMNMHQISRDSRKKGYVDDILRSFQTVTEDVIRKMLSERSKNCAAREVLTS